MPRNAHFQPDREPLHHPNLQLRQSHISGPFSFLNPTSAGYVPTPQHPDQARPTAQPKHIEHLWRSRDNRKGRHALKVDYRVPHSGPTPRPTSEFKAAIRGILRMVTCVPYWDVSYLVAIMFTLGSMVWIINGFFVWLPLEDPRSEFPGESLVGGGVSAFIGASIFEIGSVLLLLEAINANQTACFGWAVEMELEKADASVVTMVKPNKEDCTHHHANRKNLVGAGGSRPEHSREANDGTSSRGKSFRWMPSLMELRTHYLRELGFLASLVQFIAATIFWIAGFTGLPGIIDHLSQSVENGVYWVPQIVGGSGFIVSGLLFTLETQRKWYIPALHVLGWHVGFWNFIGGIGFTLCGALGPATTDSGVEYQATLATFWGSWAFMIGSTIQWYESLEKYPVERARGGNVQTNHKG